MQAIFEPIFHSAAIFRLHYTRNKTERNQPQDVFPSPPGGPALTGLEPTAAGIRSVAGEGKWARCGCDRLIFGIPAEVSDTESACRAAETETGGLRR